MSFDFHFKSFFISVSKENKLEYAYAARVMLLMRFYVVLVRFFFDCSFEEHNLLITMRITPAHFF